MVKLLEISEKSKKFNNLEESWEELLSKIDSNGDDFGYYSIKKRKKKQYFPASVSMKKIIVEAAKRLEPPAKISGKRTIDFDQFKCVAAYFHDYITGEKGIRPKIRDNCGRNSSYIISLIASLLNS